MKAKFILLCSFTVLTAYHTLSFANPEDHAKPPTNLVIEANDIYIPEERHKEEQHKVLARYAEEFTFDWNKSETIGVNQKQLQEIDGFLKKIDKPNELDPADQQLVGTLLFRLGTYYAHIADNPNLAIEKLNTADSLHGEKEAKAWDYNQLAYAYEQKYLMTRQAADREKSLYYTNKVIIDLYPKTKNKEVAFAYGVRGGVQSAAQDYTQAETQFKTALSIYESLSNTKDEQYIRLKNQLAATLLEQNNGNDTQAIKMLEDGQKFWQANNKAPNNLYAAHNLMTLGKAYLKTGNVKEAQDVLKLASTIYEKVYGSKSQQLVKPYLLLAEAYNKSGNTSLGEVYERKAKSLIG